MLGYIEPSAGGSIKHLAPKLDIRQAMPSSVKDGCTVWAKEGGPLVGRGEVSFGGRACKGKSGRWLLLGAFLCAVVLHLQDACVLTLVNKAGHHGSA